MRDAASHALARRAPEEFWQNWRVTMFRPIGQSAVVVALAFLATSPQACASVVLPMGNIFSSSGTPGGTPPYLSATFADYDSDNDTILDSVKLTMSTAGLVGSEFVGQWYFNLDTALNPLLLGFSWLSGDVADSISTGLNAFKADGDGKYDILFDFDNAPPADRFNAGETIEYKITYSGPGTFDENSFSFLSDPDGGHGPFVSAAHIQGISGGKSAWVSPGGGSTNPPPPVPEPASFAVWSMLIAAMAFVASRKK